MSDEPLKICPKCGREIRRLINGGNGVIFKGSGFYVTDNAGKSRSSEGTKTAQSAACAACAGADSPACPKAAGS